MESSPADDCARALEVRIDALAEQGDLWEFQWRADTCYGEILAMEQTRQISRAERDALLTRLQSVLAWEHEASRRD